MWRSAAYNIGKVVTAGRYQAFYFSGDEDDLWPLHLVHDDGQKAAKGTDATRQSRPFKLLSSCLLPTGNASVPNDCIGGWFPLPYTRRRILETSVPMAYFASPLLKLGTRTPRPPGMRSNCTALLHRVTSLVPAVLPGCRALRSTASRLQ